MFYFIADARDGSARDGCETCCCAPMSARPGETNMVEINYADWAAPLLGKGLAGGTVFELSPCLNCDETPPSAPPLIKTELNTPVSVSLAAFAPAEQYRIEGRFSARRGEISDFDARTGSFVYLPARGFAGYDAIWFTARRESGAETVQCLQIAAAPPAGSPDLPPPPPPAPPLAIDQGRVRLDRVNYLMRFALQVSPGAAAGDIYRLIIRQPALDCDCNKFWHEMCLDITIGKCG